MRRLALESEGRLMPSSLDFCKAAKGRTRDSTRQNALSPCSRERPRVNAFVGSCPRQRDLEGVMVTRDSRGGAAFGVRLRAAESLTLSVPDGGGLFVGTRGSNVPCNLRVSISPGIRSTRANVESIARTLRPARRASSTSRQSAEDGFAMLEDFCGPRSRGRKIRNALPSRGTNGHGKCVRWLIVRLKS
jgi:hypothetical protein